MENSGNKQFISFKLHTILSSVVGGVCNLPGSVLPQQKFEVTDQYYSPRVDQCYSPQIDQCYSSVLQLSFI